MKISGKRTALVLAAAAVLLWALARNLGRSGTPPTSTAPLSPAAPIAEPKARRKPRKTLVTQAAPLPSPAVKLRGARLRDKGEALGGRALDRADAGSAPATGAQ